jgi:hypothetical protein
MTRPSRGVGFQQPPALGRLVSTREKGKRTGEGRTPGWRKEDRTSGGEGVTFKRGKSGGDSFFSTVSLYLQGG